MLIWTIWFSSVLYFSIRFQDGPGIFVRAMVRPFGAATEGERETEREKGKGWNGFFFNAGSPESAINYDQRDRYCFRRSREWPRSPHVAAAAQSADVETRRRRWRALIRRVKEIECGTAVRQPRRTGTSSAADLTNVCAFVSYAYAECEKKIQTAPVHCSGGSDAELIYNCV